MPSAQSQTEFGRVVARKTEEGAGWKQREVGEGGEKGLTLLDLSRVGLGFAVQEPAALTLTTGDHGLLAGAAGASTAVIAPCAVSWQERRGT